MILTPALTGHAAAQSDPAHGADGTPDGDRTVAPVAAPAFVVAPSDAADYKGMIWRAEDKWATADGYNWAGIESDLRDMQAAGAGWVRIAFKQDMPLSFYDCLLPLVRQYGLKVLGNTRKMLAPKELGTPAEQEAYRTWLTEVVTRYQDHVRYWEIENETNIPSGWNICLDADCKESDPALYSQAVADYVALLQQAYTVIKGVDPALQVLIGGLCECGSERYIDELIKLDAYRYFDIMAFHPFGRSPEEVMARLDAAKAKLAQQPELAAKPIWITAIGYHTADWPGTPGRVADESVKADYLLQTLQMLREADGVEGPIFWYILSEPLAEVNGYGLMVKDVEADPATATKLPAYQAYQALWTTKQVRVLPATEDTFVSRNDPSINYDSAGKLWAEAGEDLRRTYIKFDFSELDDVTLLQAQLRFLTANDDGAGSAESQTIRLLEGPVWHESDLTYATQPLTATSTVSDAVGVISETVHGKGYQVGLDAAVLQRAIGQDLSLLIDTQSADELIIQSREWKSLLRMIVYYTTDDAGRPLDAATTTATNTATNVVTSVVTGRSAHAVVEDLYHRDDVLDTSSPFDRVWQTASGLPAAAQCMDAAPGSKLYLPWVESE